MTQRWASEGVDQPWTIGEAIGVTMGALRRHFLSIVGPLLLIAILNVALVGIPFVAVVRAIGKGEFGTLALFAAISPAGHFQALLPAGIASAAGLGLVVFTFWGLLVALLAEGSLAAVRDEPIASGRFVRALKRTPKILALHLLGLVTLAFPAILVGAIVIVHRIVTHYDGAPSPWIFVFALPCLVTGGAFVLLFGMTPFFLVDDNLPLVEAMRRSWRSAKPYLGTLFLFGFALTPVTLIGLLPILGAIATAFVFLGVAYAYVRSTGRNNLPWFTPEFASRAIRRFLKISLTAFGFLFVVLVVWVKNLPELRGSAWNIQDTAIRAGAILSGVAAIVVLLALLLPYGLDHLEGRRFTSFIAARHVRSQKSGFLTIISILSICGVAISSCALSSVVSVMGGFSQDLKRKILGNNAHIVIDTTSASPFADYDSALTKIRAVPSVVGATAVVHGEVMASSASNLAGVIVTGIDPDSIVGVIDLVHNLEVGKLDYLSHPELLTRLPPSEVIGIGPGGEQYLRGSDLPGLPDDIDPAVRAAVLDKPNRPGIILGRELAKTLHVYVGDEITLVSPLGDLGPMGIMPRTKKFRVAGVFYSGMYEYDATYVYTMRDIAQEYFQTGDKVSAIEVKVEEAERSGVATDAIVASIAREDLRVRDWREINKNLFSALKLERFATFIILSVAIMVASFCIICTLLLMVTEKGKEIAILKAVGASDRAILRTFMTEGMIIGGIGTVFGVVTGLAVCAGLSWFGLRLDPEVYYIDRLPISVNGWDFLTVALAAFSICTLSTIYPAYAASRLRPVDGLRYE